MKYFTPKRLLRLQDRSHKKHFLAALAAWENAVETYRDHLQEIHGRLPSGLRKLLGSVSLHDALVVDMWQQKSRFHITLLPQAESSKLVVLGYSLVEAPEIDREALPEALRSTQVAWLYDELDVAHSPNNGSRRTTFSHSILLNNGWEISLRFRTVSVTRPALLLPTTSGVGHGVSRSA